MQNRQVTLRALEPADVDAVYRWENDPAVWQHGVAHTPFSRHALAQYIADCGQTDIYTAKQLRLMAMDGVVAVGCVDLFDFDPYHRRAGVGLLVDQALRHQGYGRAILEALLDFARQHLQLHLVYCDVAADNEPSRRLFEGAGFERCGLRRQWLHASDGWTDAVVYQKILS